MFDPQEIVIVDGAQVGIVAPSTFQAPFKNLTRGFRANDELNEWLKTEWPDRATQTQDQPRQFATFSRRCSYWLHGGSTFDSFNPKKVTVVMIALTVRWAAKWNGKHQRMIGKHASW
jgi:hypothetical protein